MWISKKKYNELIEQRDNYERIASETIQLNGRVIDSNERILEEMKGVQELNHRLQQHNDELLARVKELEADLQGARQTIQQWADDFEELDIAYGELEIERDRYKERVEAFEEGKYLTREAE